MANKKPSKRGKYMSFILYPQEDWRHRALLRNLLSPDRLIPAKIMCINHKGKGKIAPAAVKPHTHCMLAFENARSDSSVQKMLGVNGTVWRLYTMQLSSVTDDLQRNGTLVQRVRKEHWSKVPVLSDPSDPTSYIDYPYDDRVSVAEVTRRHPIEDDQCYIRSTQFTVKHVEVVDFQAYAAYMLHKTYQCLLDSKERYEISDLYGDEDLIIRAFPSTDPFHDGGMLERLYALCGQYEPREVSRILMDNGDFEALDFLKSHSTFVRDWFLPKKVK